MRCSLRVMRGAMNATPSQFNLIDRWISCRMDLAFAAKRAALPLSSLDAPYQLWFSGRKSHFFKWSCTVWLDLGREEIALEIRLVHQRLEFRK